MLDFQGFPGGGVKFAGAIIIIYIEKNMYVYKDKEEEFHTPCEVSSAVMSFSYPRSFRSW